jgi:hypothetical protein
MKKRASHRSIKKILYAIIVGFAIVAFWRGTWMLMDIFLFPDNDLFSSLSAIFIGILILVFTKNLIERLG